MSAQHSGQNNKGPRGQVDSFLVVNCTFSHLLLIKKCKWWLCKHWLQYLKPEKEKASPGSLLLLISLLLVCPCLSSPGVRNSLAALSYLMFLCQSQITTPGQLETDWKRETLRGKEIISLSWVTRSWWKLWWEGLTRQWNASINLSYSHSAKLA